MSFSRVAWVLIALGALAGCSSSDAPVGAPSQPAETREAATPEPAPSGTPERVLEFRGEGEWVASLSAPCPDDPSKTCTSGGSRPAEFWVEEAAPSSATLTAHWNATTPAGARINVWLYRQGVGVVGSAEGPSPLVVDIDESAMSVGSYFANARAPSPGAMAGQNVTFVLRLVYAPAPPP